MKDTKDLLTVEQVAVLIGSSCKSIENWYRFKREYPEHELAKMLPDYIQEGLRQKRYWKRSDLWKFAEFKSKVPRGRNGVMGAITQKYVHKEKNDE